MSTLPTVIFFGTPDFVIPVLEKLQSIAQIAGVFSRPEKAAGRGLNVLSSPVQRYAEQHRLPVFTPARLGDQETVALLKRINPIVAVVFAYGKIIPGELLKIPSFGFLNVHPSLLPKYRGPSPIATAILNGESETGVSIILLDEHMDHGPMLSQARVPITVGEHRPVIEERLASVGAALLASSLIPYLDGRQIPRPQDDSQATYTKLLGREDGHIRWTDNAGRIAKMICAYDSWPGTWSTMDGQILKILSARPMDGQSGAPGQLAIAQGQLSINCGRDRLMIERLQLAGRSPQTAGDFIRGHQLIHGRILV